MKLIRDARRAAAVLTLGAALSGCEDAFGPGGQTPGQVTLKFEAPTASGFSASISADGEGTAPAAATVEVKTVQLVLAKIKLDRVHEEEECEDEDRDSCEQFRTGPLLVTLPLTADQKVAPLTARPPAGSYDKLEFKIHRPEGKDSLSRAFFEANPDWPASAAIRVMGTYTPVGGAARDFDLPLKLSTKIRQRFSPPLVVDETTDPASLSLTVEVDVKSWFADGRGGVIDPQELLSNPRLLSLLERNIRESFETRRDEDDDEKKSGKGKKEGKGKDGKKDDKDDKNDD